jgi:hypothetical protein
MAVAYEAIFSPSKKHLDNIILSSYNLLSESGLSFQNLVWKLSSVNGTPEVSDHQPVQVNGIEEVADRTRRWWGRSMEWFSRKVGEVYLRIFSADGEGYHIVYNEGSGIHRMREQDEELQNELLSLLLKLSEAFDSDLSTYTPESTDWFRPPSLSDLREAMERGPKWDGDLFIVSERVLDPALKREIESLEPPLKRTTTGRYIVNYFGTRAAH